MLFHYKWARHNRNAIENALKFINYLYTTALSHIYHRETPDLTGSNDKFCPVCLSVLSVVVLYPLPAPRVHSPGTEKSRFLILAIKKERLYFRTVTFKVSSSRTVPHHFAESTLAKIQKNEHNQIYHSTKNCSFLENSMKSLTQIWKDLCSKHISGAQSLILDLHYVSLGDAEHLQLMVSHGKWMYSVYDHRSPKQNSAWNSPRSFVSKKSVLVCLLQAKFLNGLSHS